MKISIDFDNCLSTLEVQNVAKELISQGHEVFILTSRFDTIKRLQHPELHSNADLYKIAEEVGIKPINICFTNQELKAKHLFKSGIDIHVDDDKSTLIHIRDSSTTKGFNCTDVNFKTDLYNYINLAQEF